MVGCVHVCLLLLFYQAHKLLGFTTGLVLFQYPSQDLLCIIVLLDLNYHYYYLNERFRQDKPSLFKLLSILRLILLLKDQLQKVLSLSLLLIQILENRTCEHCRSILASLNYNFRTFFNTSNSFSMDSLISKFLPDIIVT